jgi:hypothetical protein
MQFVSRDQIASVAELHDAGPALQTRPERLARWAELLGREPDLRLRSLGEIEFLAEADRAALRVDGSPLTVAFQDPVLRGSGLGSDRYGDAVRFFGLSDREAHRLLCSCMNGFSMQAGTTARRVERLARRTPARVLAPLAALWTAIAAGAGALWLAH